MGGIRHAATLSGADEFAAGYAAISGLPDAGEDFERVVRRVYEALLAPGDLAVDVGAHVGKHALPMALAVAPAGHVVAVEPIPWAADRLSERVALAGLTKVVTVVRGCCGAEQLAEVAFHVVPDHPGWSAKHVRSRARQSEEVRVPQHTVDGLCDTVGRPARFVKIDVEGAEPDVLAGAERLLRQHRPVVHVEVGLDALAAHGHAVESVRDHLADRGYRLYDLLGVDVTEPAVWRASAAARGVFDYLAVHVDDPAAADVVHVLGTSFGAARAELAAHDLPALLPRLRDLPEHPTLSAPEPVVDETLVLPPESVSPPVRVGDPRWPGYDGDPVPSAVLWTGSSANVLDLRSGGLRALRRPVAVTLPLDVGALTLTPWQQVRVGITVEGNAASTRQSTLVEVAVDGRSALVGAVRLRPEGLTEVAWTRRGRAVTVASHQAKTAGTHDVTVTATAGGVHLRAAKDGQVAAAVWPLRRRGGITVRLMVGGSVNGLDHALPLETPAVLSMSRGAAPAGVLVADLRHRIVRRVSGRSVTRVARRAARNPRWGVRAARRVLGRRVRALAARRPR